MDKWSLFVISIGLLFIASSPVFANQLISIIMGVVFVLGGIYLYQKSKKG